MLRKGKNPNQYSSSAFSQCTQTYDSRYLFSTQVYALPAKNTSNATYLSQDSGQTFNKIGLPFHPVYLEAKPRSSLDVVMLMAATQVWLCCNFLYC